MYFRLNPECYYIKGAKNGAIYDLIDGTIYALTSDESKTIESCEENREVDPEDPFLLGLKHQIIGNFFTKKVFIEKIRLGSPIGDYQEGLPPMISSAVLEIGNECNRSCWYCGQSGISRSRGCLGCNTWHEEGTPVSVERWKDLIVELEHLHCMSLLIKGGDLVKDWDKTREILDFATGHCEKVFLIGHRENFSKDKLEYLEEKVNLILQTDTLSDIENRHTYLLPVDYAQSPEVSGDMPENVLIDLVSRTFTPLQPGSPLNSKKKIPKTNVFMFTHNNRLHPCLANSVTIAWNGEVLPCPMMRKHSLGNIRDRKLWTFFKGTKDSIQEYWNISLTSLDKCRMCEFRYACTDCRALEAAKTGDLKSKVLCDYDPAKGTWQQPAA
jgi:radical SAM protein with 4Fe4S-binding SPASM domain